MSNEYYTYSKLIEFGFSKKLILQKFPDPILKQNPIYKNAAPMKLYKKDDVDEYIHNGQINFAQEDYINTHVYLYSQKNIHRNFEMSFDIVGLGNSSNNDTLMSATKNIFSIANASNETMNLYTTGKTAGNSVEGIPNTITNVRLIRIDDKLYYSLNGQTFLKINDYAGVTSYSNRPVLFGADFKRP